MGGINIYCGSFIGRDKSGTPFEAVLADIAGEAGSDGQDVIRRIDEALETASDHVLVLPADASALIDALSARLGFYGSDEQGDQQRICTEDLLKACQTSVAEGEPIALVW